MARFFGRFGRQLALAALTWPSALAGCNSSGARVQLAQENDSLRQNNQRLERTVQQRDSAIARLTRQIENLKRFQADRPADLFAPVSLEIASLSGGRDYDRRPGDDGVTIFLRPRDADGDAVKVPGRIEVQLLDNTVLGSPRVVGVYVFDDPDKLREFWHGRFGTNHYTLRCPFAPDVVLPESRRLTASVSFLDYLTGATLTAVKELTIDFPGN